MTQDVLGELFGMTQPVAHKWIHFLLPVLNRALADVGELPARETKPFEDEMAPLPARQTAAIAPSAQSTVQKTHKTKRLQWEKNNTPYNLVINAL